MPERLPCDEAMLFSQARLRITDTEIKRGKVELVNTETQGGKITRPWGIEGGFAVVYKFRTVGGQLRALRCFRIPMKPDTQFRYEHIGPYFHKHAPAITAGFKYHDQGILIKEQGQPQGNVYPVIEMDWVDGLTLLEKVDELCQQRDTSGLKDLATQWLNILETMQKAHIAHGDLAGVNVMVRSDGRMLLIDYDGVYIPEFANLPQILLGQSDFQHPQMYKRQFNEHMDAFSAMVIYTVLLALAAQPELWQKYTKRTSQGELLDGNLMLTQQDFQEPQQSRLFQELEQSKNQLVRTFVRELKRACQQPIDQVRFPFHLIDPDYTQKQALEQFKILLQLDDDTQIVQAWSALEQYAPAQVHRQRVVLAKQRLTALARFRTALQSQQLARIAAAYDTILTGCITAQERILFDLAHRFIEAYNNNDDATLSSLAEHLRRHQAITLTSQEQQRITQAQQRQQVQQDWQEALHSKNPERIAASYTQLQQIFQLVSKLSPYDQQVGELAIQFVQAYNNTDERALIAAYEAIHNFQYRTAFNFSAHQQRIDLAMQNEGAIARFRVALANRNISNISAAFSNGLEQSSQLSADERAQGQLALAFTLACTRNDDATLIATYDAIRHEHQALVFTEQEQQQVELAHQRREADIKLQFALATKKPRIIVAAYQAAYNNQIAPEIHDLAHLAQQIIDAKDDEQLCSVYEAIQHSHYRDLLEFTAQEQQRIAVVQQRKIALQTLEKAINAGEPDKIISAYEGLPADLRSYLDPGQQEYIDYARKALEMHQSIQRAIQNQDYKTLLNAYDAQLTQYFPQLIQPWEQAYINDAYKAQQILIARREGEYEQALRIAKETFVTGGFNGQKPYLIVAMRRVMREIVLTEVKACIEPRKNGNWLKVSWLWPENNLIQDILLLWDAYMQPVVPHQLNTNELHQLKNYALISRDAYQREGQKKLHVGKYTSIFTTICAVMYDEWDREAEIKTWCSSPVIAQTAQLCTRAPITR